MKGHKRKTKKKKSLPATANCNSIQIKLNVICISVHSENQKMPLAVCYVLCKVYFSLSEQKDL